MSKDADMRSHVILSMIKVAKAEALDVPPLPSSATSSKLFQFKGSCSSLHVAGSCCNLTNILVVFNLIIILLCSNCQVMFALWRYRKAKTAHTKMLRYFDNSSDFLRYHYIYYRCKYIKSRYLLSSFSSLQLLLPSLITIKI